MPFHSSLAIANEFIDRARRARRPITHMHLQKFVYLAHGWNLAVNSNALIEDPVEAWEFGPVVRRLYDALRSFGSAAIANPIGWGADTDFRSDDRGPARARLLPEESAVIDRVWDVYGGYEAFQLSALTHAPGTPWERTYQRGRNHIIEQHRIQDYFSEIASRDD